jgi:rSAM/selenodomain-associated transferase 1
MMKALSRLLLIFVKNPQPGKVKTRLARTIGDARALEVYRQLLKHTVQITREVQADKAVFYTEFIEDQDIWPDDLYQKYLQQGDDLGQRMQQAFSQAFGQGYDQVAIIGSDCPQLTTAIIQEAFTALQTNQVVIGPAADGGYYLLGMRTLIPELFAGKKWSSPSVLPDTLTDLQRLQLLYYKLPILHDVDQEEDLYLLDFPSGQHSNL